MQAYKVLLGFWLGVSAALHLVLMFWLPVVGVDQASGSTRLTAPQAAAAPALRVFLVPVQTNAGISVATAPVDATQSAPAAAIAVQAPHDNSTSTETRVAAAAPLALPLPYNIPREEDYFRRRDLSVPAEPLGQIDIPDPGPGALPAAGRAIQVVVLTLLISESGRVDRILFETEPVPGALERAVRKAFEPARFVPGQIDGKPVKSRMRIEVRFEAVDLKR